MSALLRITGLLLSVSLPFAANAVDLPTVVEGSEAYNQEDCISTTTDQCIQSICLTSSATDCTDQCATDAQDKCAEQSDE